MAAVAGITTKKNIKGQITHVTVDVKKHSAMIPMFNELGLLPKTKFQKERENGITVNELKDSLLEQIDELWSK
jgi:hypothetical protein